MAVQVTVENLTGEVSPSELLPHNRSQALPCEAANAGMGGSLLLFCSEGILTADYSTCYVAACLRGLLPGAQALLGGFASEVVNPQDIKEGTGFWIPCRSIRAGYKGTAQLTCNGGVLGID